MRVLYTKSRADSDALGFALIDTACCILIVVRTIYCRVDGEGECSVQMPIADPSMACHRLDRRLGIHLRRINTS